MKFNCVNSIGNYLYPITIFLFFCSCAEQEVVPINQFATESFDSTTAQVFLVEGLGEVFVNQDRFRYTEEGVEILGTVFTASESGMISLSSGDFVLGEEVDGIYQSLEGYGLPQLPDVSFFKDFESIVNPGAFISFRTGAEIKQDDPQAPLQDEISYLAISPDAVLDTLPTFEIGNSTLSMGAFYIDPSDPSVYLNGSIEGPLPLENAGVGLSANSKLIFQPYEYSEDLESIMLVPLEEVAGNIFIKGEIPIPQYSILLVGEATVGLELNENGPRAFFEDGIEAAEFRMGMNGSVFLTNQALEYMPSDVELELGRSTVILNTEQAGQNYLQAAGEMSTGDLAGKLLAGIDNTGFFDNVRFPGSTVEAYAYIGDDLDNSQFYISNSIQVEIPGLGEQELARAILEITSDYVRAEGRLEIPGALKVKLKGQFDYDGEFFLSGDANFNLDVEVARLEVKLSVSVGNVDGFKADVRVRACIEGECSGVSASVDVNWNTGKTKVCANVPGYGQKCAHI